MNPTKKLGSVKLKSVPIRIFQRREWVSSVKSLLSFCISSSHFCFLCSFEDVKPPPEELLPLSLASSSVMYLLPYHTIAKLKLSLVGLMRAPS